MYGDVRSWVFGDPQEFTYRLRSGVTDELATAHMRFTMGFGIDADLAPSHHTLLAMLGGDHYRLTSQYGEAVLRPGDVAAVPAGAALQVSLHALDVITVSLSAADLSRTAEEIYGHPAADFALADMTPSSSAQAAYLNRLAVFASGEMLAKASGMEHPLLRQQLTTTLCVAFLATFATTATRDDHQVSSGAVTPRALRRAIAYIEANAAKPVTLTDIADAAGTSSRAVQHAFVRHRDTTPTAYLRRVRLERAHSELQAADPTRGDTVAAIARRWGFGKAGRFAAAYRAAYGVNPQQTLRS